MIAGLETLRNGRQASKAMERVDVPGVLVVMLLVVVGIGALAELVAGRAVAQPETTRAGTWPVLVRTADEALARGDLPAARRAYRSAMFRARGERSIVGILEAAEGFRALGDREVVEQALRMAAALGPDDGPGVARVQALRDRLHATDALPIGPR